MSTDDNDDEDDDDGDDGDNLFISSRGRHGSQVVDDDDDDRYPGAAQPPGPRLLRGARGVQGQGARRAGPAGRAGPQGGAQGQGARRHAPRHGLAARHRGMLSLGTPASRPAGEGEPPRMRCARRGKKKGGGGEPAR